MTVPRSVDEILAHAEEMAREFEEYTPAPGDERDPEAFLALRRATLLRAEAERSVEEAVQRARDRGFSWRSIGAVLGTSGEAARQRYGGQRV